MLVYLVFQNTDNIEFLLEIIEGLIEKGGPEIGMSFIYQLYRFWSKERLFDDQILENMEQICS